MSSTITKRSLVVGALLSAAAAAVIVPASFSVASARDASSATRSQAPWHRAAATPNRQETVEERIASLHAALKITPDEEMNWTAVAVTMRASAATMQKLVDDAKAKAPETMTAPDDLKTYELFSRAHLDGLKDLILAFGTLYAAMPAAQRKIADDVFHRANHESAPMHG